MNYIDFLTENETLCIIRKTEKTGFSVSVPTDEMNLTGSAEKAEGINGKYICGISSAGGSAYFRINVPEAGSYRMTVSYANNDEGGVHSYNVDLIERYITVDVNGKKSNLWCRNTYSWDTVKTVTMNIELEAGDNEIILSNDGSNKFNNRDSYVPHIYGVTINKLS